MCQKCLDLVIRFFPDATDRERLDLLWEFTSYPFGDPEKIEEQLLALSEKGEGGEQ